MSLTPVELRHVKLGRGMAGYDTKQTDKLLDEVAASLTEVWEERGALRARLKELEEELADTRRLLDEADGRFDLERRAMRARIAELEQAAERHREMEQALQGTLRAAQDVRSELVTELDRRIETSMAGAREETARMIDEVLTQYRARLLSALELASPMRRSRSQESLLEVLSLSGRREAGDATGPAPVGPARESVNGPMQGR
jgi:cell division septum initiation protein DivIVA